MFIVDSLFYWVRLDQNSCVPSLATGVEDRHSASKVCEDHLVGSPATTAPQNRVDGPLRFGLAAQCRPTLHRVRVGSHLSNHLHAHPGRIAPRVQATPFGPAAADVVQRRSDGLRRRRAARPRPTRSGSRATGRIAGRSSWTTGRRHRRRSSDRLLSSATERAR